MPESRKRSVMKRSERRNIRRDKAAEREFWTIINKAISTQGGK
jgi:hypothetical protein